MSVVVVTGDIIGDGGHYNGRDCPVNPIWLLTCYYPASG